MSSSLLLQQCSACLIHLILIVNCMIKMNIIRCYLLPNSTLYIFFSDKKKACTQCRIETFQGVFRKAEYPLVA